METKTNTEIETFHTLDLQEGEKIYDSAFVIRKQRWGTYVSHALSGRQLITGTTEEIVEKATRFYLKGEQEGWPESEIVHEGTVGGKL